MKRTATTLLLLLLLVGTVSAARIYLIETSGSGCSGNCSAGPPGPAGTNGTNGTNGLNGTSVYLSTVANLGNGSYQWNFSNNTNGTPVVLSFVTANLKGDTGATGATGSQGPQGDPGTPGTNGTNGVNGTNGLNGTNASVVAGGIYINITSGVVDANISSFDLRYYLSSNPSSYTTLPAVIAAIQNTTICHTDGTNCPTGALDSGSGWRNTSLQVTLVNNATNVSVGLTSGVPSLFVDNTNGRVLIGTSQSSSELNVNGSISLSSDETITSLADGSNYVKPFEAVTGRMVLRTGGTDRVSVLYTGNVGIGTSSPTQQLHVVGNTNFTGDIYGTNDSGIPKLYFNASAPRLHIGENISQAGILSLREKSGITASVYLVSNAAPAGIAVQRLDTGVWGRFSAGASLDFFWANGKDLIFYEATVTEGAVNNSYSGANPRLRIEDGGNMTVDPLDNAFFFDYTNNRFGIGSTLPAQKLVVNGNANFTGEVSIGSYASAPNTTIGNMYLDTTPPGAFCGRVNSTAWVVLGGAGTCS